MLKVAIFIDRPSNSRRHDRYSALAVFLDLLAAFTWGLAARLNLSRSAIRSARICSVGI
jgi:hypothetical protein